MALIFVGKPREAAVQKEYTILDAIKEYAHGRTGVLTVSHCGTGHSYVVVGYDDSTGKTTLKSLSRSPVTIRVKLGPREAALYRPVWRD